MQVCKMVLKNIFKKIITVKNITVKNKINFVYPLTHTYVHIYNQNVSGIFAFLKSVWRAST